MLLSTFALTEGHSILPRSIKIVGFICYTSLLISWISYARRQAIYVKRNIVALSRNHCCRVKAISITYSRCVFVDLYIPHSMRMLRIRLPSVAYRAVPYFSTLYHKGHDFRKMFLNTKCVFWFALQLSNISHTNKNWARYCHICIWVYM